MRKITTESVKAFTEQVSYTKDNTKVRIENDWALTISRMYLYDNLIATYTVNAWTKSDLHITSAGWETVTTKERLNWILDAFNLWSIYQKKWVWYYTNNEWVGEFNWGKTFII